MMFNHDSTQTRCLFVSYSRATNMKHNRIYSIIHYWNTFSKNSDKSGQCLWGIGAFLFDLSFQNIMKPKLIKGFVLTLPVSQFAYISVCLHVSFCLQMRIILPTYGYDLEELFWKRYLSNVLCCRFCCVSCLLL